MPVTNCRDLLQGLLIECKNCKVIFDQNVGLILDDSEHLSDEQVEAIFIRLSERHREHQDDLF